MTFRVSARNVLIHYNFKTCENGDMNSEPQNLTKSLLLVPTRKTIVDKMKTYENQFTSLILSKEKRKGCDLSEWAPVDRPTQLGF